MKLEQQRDQCKYNLLESRERLPVSFVIETSRWHKGVVIQELVTTQKCPIRGVGQVGDEPTLVKIVDEKLTRTGNGIILMT